MSADDKRRRKRYKREHSNRTPVQPVQREKLGGVRLSYRPKDKGEGQRRVDRIDALRGTPFVRLPGNTPDGKVLFTTTDGTDITAEGVQMVFNDMLLMDAVSDWGKDGPRYAATIDPRTREVLVFAIKAYEGVEIPATLRPPDMRV